MTNMKKEDLIKQNGKLIADFDYLKSEDLRIRKDCQRCTYQLDYEDGFNENKTLCNKCESIIKFDLQAREALTNKDN